MKFTTSVNFLDEVNGSIYSLLFTNIFVSLSSLYPTAFFRTIIQHCKSDKIIVEIWLCSPFTIILAESIAFAAAFIVFCRFFFVAFICLTTRGHEACMYTSIYYFAIC